MGRLVPGAREAPGVLSTVADRGPFSQVGTGSTGQSPETFTSRSQTPHRPTANTTSGLGPDHSTACHHHLPITVIRFDRATRQRQIVRRDHSRRETQQGWEAGRPPLALSCQPSSPTTSVTPTNSPWRPSCRRSRVLSERLGHSSVQTTWDIYAHVMPGQDTDFADRFDQHVYGTG